MPEKIVKDKSKISNFDREGKIFYLETQDEDKSTVAISFNTKLEGLSNGNARSVNVDFPSDNYEICRLANPFLIAQNDVFKIKAKEEEKVIGYVFPASALLDDAEDTDDDFDEYKQAYKFYCIKLIIEQFTLELNSSTQPIELSQLLTENVAYIIISKSLLTDKTISLTDFLPSLALYGYYHFPDKLKPDVMDLLSEGDDETAEIVEKRFHQYRGQENLSVKSSKVIFEKSEMIASLYKKLLVRANNPLYRFLILYQVIEYLVEDSFSIGLEKIIKERLNLNSKFKFVEQVNMLTNTRTAINKLFERVHFDEKNEITSILKSFINEFDNGYDKQTTGDCFYDIRNLLFHDYRSVLGKDKDKILTSLIIQCELLIHHLVITLSNDKETAEEKSDLATSVKTEVVEIKQSSD